MLGVNNFFCLFWRETVVPNTTINVSRKKKITFLYLKIVIFYSLKNHNILHRHVNVVADQS